MSMLHCMHSLWQSEQTNYYLLSNNQLSNPKWTANCRAPLANHTKLQRYVKAAQMWFRLERQIRKGSLLFCRPWRFHCPSAEAIWPPVPRARGLNTSRCHGSHNAPLESKFYQTVRGKSNVKLCFIWRYRKHFLTKFFLFCSCVTWANRWLKRTFPKTEW